MICIDSAYTRFIPKAEFNTKIQFLLEGQNYKL